MESSRFQRILDGICVGGFHIAGSGPAVNGIIRAISQKIDFFLLGERKSIPPISHEYNAFLCFLKCEILPVGSVIILESNAMVELSVVDSLTNAYAGCDVDTDKITRSIMAMNLQL